MVLRLLPLVLLVFLAAPLSINPGAAESQANPTQDRSERVKKGIGHFDRAFYGLTPHKRDAEAAHEFDLAIGEFEAELQTNPTSLEAHRYLARIFTVRKAFRQAAQHYDEMCRLDAGNVDAYVLAALAWIEAREPGEARARLLDAKAHTADPRVLATLNEYLAKLDRLREGRRP